MKIGVDIRCLMEKKYSGISEYTYNLLNHLLKIDQKNQYFLFYNSAKETKIPDFNFSNVTIRGFKYPNKIFNLSLRFLKIAEIDKMIGGVDLFLIPNFLFLNISLDCKKILIVHDLSFELYPKFFTFKKRLWHKLINPKKICQQVDKIIAISENTKNDIIRLYQIPREKIEVIYPGINEIFFQEILEAEKIRVKEKYHLPENYLLYLGNLEPRKNIETLILAFEKIKTPNFYLVVGGAAGWKNKAVYQLWQKSFCKENIKFIGYVDSSERPALYSLAKIFIYPSIYEGFGLPPVEAMATATTIITSFSSSLPEAVGEAAILIDPHNFNELAQIIDKILIEPSLIERLKNKEQKLSQQFRWQTKTEEILKIINSLNQKADVK